MAHENPRDHHYVPQFYLREFASNTERTKIRTVARNGDFAVFAERAIKNLGYERDFYVHLQKGVPVNLEVAINAHAETPISSSDTWRKISTGQESDLDHTDKKILYPLIRHLEARSPHAREIAMELAQLAADPNSEIPFTAEEREMYAAFRRNKLEFRRFMNFRAVSMPWTERDFHGSMLSILRSPIPLRTSTVPVLSLSAPEHPAIRLPLPGQVPFSYALSLNRKTVAMLTFGDFDGAFSNQELPIEAATMINRTHVMAFAKYKHVRHLIGDDELLTKDMTWAPYDLLETRMDQMKFKRRPEG